MSPLPTTQLAAPNEFGSLALASERSSIRRTTGYTFLSRGWENVSPDQSSASVEKHSSSPLAQQH
jgi:hypothetical protein